MNDYLYFLWIYAGPFVAVASFIVLWSVIVYKLQDRYPKPYEWTGKILYDYGPSVLTWAVVVTFMIFLFLD